MSRPDTVPERMRAAVFTGPRRVEIRNVPVPQPGPGQVLIRMEGCGLCGSNLPLWQGRPWFRYPTAPGEPGHEGWGRVVAVGELADASVPVGARVAALSYHALAEYDLADSAAVVLLPEGLGDAPVPGEPLGCAMNIFRRSEIHAGDKVAVVGIGFIGAMITQLAVRAGAQVFALSRRPFARALAERLGAVRTAPLAEASAQEVVNWSGGDGCGRVVEAVGSQEALNLATQLAGTRGRLIVAGFHQDGLRQVDMRLWNWRGLDVINAHEREPAVYVEGIRAAVDGIASARLDPAPLYTHRFSLDRIAMAFEAMEGRPDRFLKALVLP